MVGLSEALRQKIRIELAGFDPAAVRLTVFGGAGGGDDPLFARESHRIGQLLAQRGIDVIFGGGKNGIMGAVAEGALQMGGVVIGISPEFMAHIEPIHNHVTRQILVETMAERKALLIDLAEGFIILPGGIGTLDEFFDVLCNRKLHRHEKPIFIVNTNGYWDELLRLVEAIIAHKFSDAATKNLLHVVANGDELMAGLEKIVMSASDNNFSPAKGVTDAG
ncbi:MAG: TIGR00730 family Rossman fold protein [Candidatus Symbiobacter sp.]|nr:TIGR00730 family Rossman fold protein [Candidatus Symbiobacter sp.]